MATNQAEPTKYIIKYSWPPDKKQNAGNASRSLRDIVHKHGRGAKIAESEENAIVAERILKKYGASVTVEKWTDAKAPPEAGPGPYRVEITYKKVRNIDKDVKKFQGRLEIISNIRNNSIIVRGDLETLNEFLLQLGRDGGKDVAMEFV